MPLLGEPASERASLLAEERAGAHPAEATIGRPKMLEHGNVSDKEKDVARVSVRILEKEYFRRLPARGAPDLARLRPSSSTPR